jgi:hypothetical protein
MNCKSSLQTKRNIEAQIANDDGYFNGILSNIVSETGFYLCFYVIKFDLFNKISFLNCYFN